MHLEVDLNSPFGIKGLTGDMEKMFSKNKIDADDIKDNPGEMIKIVKAMETDEPIPENQLLTNADFNK